MPQPAPVPPASGACDWLLQTEWKWVSYLSLLLPLELLPVDPARVRLPLVSPESLLVSVPMCSLELALLTVLGGWQEEEEE